MQFEYEIKYSKRKTLNITVERDRKIIVRAPENTSVQKIEEVLQSKKQWLKEKINHFNLKIFFQKKTYSMMPLVKMKLKP